MTIGIVQFKAHHFIPMCKDLQTNVIIPNAPVFKDDADYRKELIQKMSISFTFPENHYPFRVHDIFVVNPRTKLIMRNRPIYVNGQEVMSSYNYDLSTRTITFSTALTERHEVHWLDFSKLRVYQGRWRRLELASKPFITKSLIQGFTKANYGLSNPESIIDEEGVFQGGFRCFLEINTLPVYGMVCYSDDMKAFLYRGSTLIPQRKDTFQFRLYNSLGQESEPYCYKLNLIE